MTSLEVLDLFKSHHYSQYLAYELGQVRNDLSNLLQCSKKQDELKKLYDSLSQEQKSVLAPILNMLEAFKNGDDI